MTWKPACQAPLLPILLSIAGVAGIYLYSLRILSYHPLAHIIYYNQSPIFDTVFIQLLTIVSRAHALPYTAYDLSNQHSICNLSIIHKRGEKRKKRKKKTIQEKRKSHKQEFRSREKLNDRMKTGSYNLELLSAIKDSFPPRTNVYGTWETEVPKCSLDHTRESLGRLKWVWWRICAFLSHGISPI